MKFPEDKQITKLNTQVKCKLAPSPIHGIGVFAMRDIGKGETLYCRVVKRKWVSIPFQRFDEIREDVRELILQSWPVVRDDFSFLSPNSTTRLVNFMNHSGTPNYCALDDTALRDIKKGEEITYDYSFDADELEECCCGSEKCKGYINDPDSEDTKKLLEKHSKKL